MIKIAITGVLMYFALSIGAQMPVSYVETKNARRSLQYAQDFIHKKEYQKALKQLKYTIKLKEDFSVSHLELARVYLELKDYAASKKAFERSFELNPAVSRAGYYEASEACFQLGEIDLASEYLNKFHELKNGSYANSGKEDATERVYEVLYQERKSSHEFLLKGDYKKLDNLEVKLMDGEINSPTDEYLPTVSANGSTLVFTRTGIDGNQDVMKAQHSGLNWDTPTYFDHAINTDENEGMARFSADNRLLYFAGCMREDTKGGCDLYIANYKDGNVSSVHRIADPLNSEAWDSQPSITCDGKTLFFSSTREGGFGGADIYFSKLGNDGSWTIAQNMGEMFNTIGDEEAPFISSDGNTLYFTSTGLPGMGDGDLFLSRKIAGNWSKPENMGYPINSQGKELGIYVQADGETANFSSARKGGKGGLDLYQVTLPEEMRPETVVHVEGFVVDSETQKPVTAAVDIIRAKQKFQVETDKEGRFFICLPSNQAFSFQTQPEGYGYHISAEYFESNDNKQSRQIKIELNPEKEVSKPAFSKIREIKERRIQFFFPFDSYDITSETQGDLNQLIQLLEKETWWKLEIIGYADSSGDAAYNLKLSEKRAKVIADFLQASGFAAQQVYKQGKGSAQDGNKQLARRVDVRLHR